MTRKMTDTERMASEHADGFVKTVNPIIRLTYFEAFKEGYKHGFKDAEAIYEKSKSD